MSSLIDVATKEILRKEILQLCVQALPDGCSMDVLAAAFTHTGETGREELERQVDYLEAKNLVSLTVIENRKLNISRKIVKITAEGIDYMEGNGHPVPGIGE